jgi:alkylation response protein AidB-like acyl-CoA dehydrogenase
VDFALTDEQEMLRETARALLANEWPVSSVRSFAEDPSVAEDLWSRHLRDWVVLGEGPLVDHCLFLEECGAVLVPGPYFATSALFLPLLRAAGDSVAELAELAESVAAGEVTGSVLFDDRECNPLVIDAHETDWLALVGPGPAVCLVRSADLRLTEVQTIDWTRRLFLAEDPGATGPRLVLDAAAWQTVIDRATVALAAELIGTSRWLLDTAVAYAKDRVQFGRPIGSFQGLQYKLVDMALDHERAVAAVYYAAMAFEAGDDDRHRAAHVAKAAAGTAARRDARDGMQVHGGIGYTWEHDLHLYLRRAYASDYLLGTTAWHHDRLAGHLFAPP